MNFRSIGRGALGFLAVSTVGALLTLGTGCSAAVGTEHDESSQEALPKCDPDVPGSCTNHGYCANYGGRALDGNDTFESQLIAAGCGYAKSYGEAGNGLFWLSTTCPNNSTVTNLVAAYAYAYPYYSRTSGMSTHCQIGMAPYGYVNVGFDPNCTTCHIPIE